MDELATAASNRGILPTWARIVAMMPSRRQLIGHAELLLGVLFSLLNRAIAVVSGRSRAGLDLLIVGPSTKSVGDRAMFEAFWQALDRPLTVLLPAPDAVDPTEEPPPNVSFVDYPGLLYGGFRRYLPDLWRYCRLASVAQSVSIVGADVMDGRYDSNASIRRFRAGYFASLSGANSRVLGFSWNESPPRTIVKEMRRASRRVMLLSRDPVSARRLRNDGAMRVTEVADLAFLTRPIAETQSGTAQIEAFIANERSLGRGIMALNINNLLERHADQVTLFEKVLPTLISDGLSVVLLPHDTRGTPSDLDLLDELYRRLEGSGRTFLERKALSPQAICRIAGLCDFVVTGRMHLAILAAVASTPSLALSYQGKIEGLYQMLGLRHWLDADHVGGDEILDAIRVIASDADDARTSLAAQLPALQASAFRNIP